MKTQYLTTIEFRYTDAPKGSDDTKYINKVVTLGVFDSLQAAQQKGNEVLTVLEANFKLNPHYSGKIERLGQGRYLQDLIARGYILTPFDFYLKITPLKYEDLESVIIEATEGCKRYREYKAAEKED